MLSAQYVLKYSEFRRREIIHSKSVTYPKKLENWKNKMQKVILTKKINM